MPTRFLCFATQTTANIKFKDNRKYRNKLRAILYGVTRYHSLQWITRLRFIKKRKTNKRKNAKNANRKKEHSPIQHECISDILIYSILRECLAVSLVIAVCLPLFFLFFFISSIQRWTLLRVSRCFFVLCVDFFFFFFILSEHFFRIHFNNGNHFITNYYYKKHGWEEYFALAIRN